MRFLTCCLVLLLATSLWAQPAPVAQVESIAGDGHLFYQDAGKTSWYRAFVEMDNYKGQHLKTDKGSMATLRFKLGGLANLAKGSEIEIVSERNVEVVGNTLLLKSGSLWAKVEKQKEELKIKTAGGVMAIKGTEFVVQVDDNGDTKLSLLEGSVVVQPEVGESYQAEPGAEVTFGRGRRLVARLRSTQELLQGLRGELGENFFEMRQNLRETRQQLRALRSEMRSDLEDYRENTLDALAQSGLLTEKQRNKRRRTNRPARAMGQVTFDAQGRPQFSYPDLGASEYVLMLSRSDSFAGQLDWVVRTSQTQVSYPEDAKPLETGSYRWGVLPLDASGRLMGPARGGRFTRP